MRTQWRLLITESFHARLRVFLEPRLRTLESLLDLPLHALRRSLITFHGHHQYCKIVRLPAVDSEQVPTNTHHGAVGLPKFRPLQHTCITNFPDCHVHGVRNIYIPSIIHRKSLWMVHLCFPWFSINKTRMSFWWTCNKLRSAVCSSPNYYRGN